MRRLAELPEAAAEQFIMNSVALQELASKYEAFVPALQIAATLATKTSNLGATLRLFFAASLSMFDFVTDVIMIRDYFQAGQTRSAQMLLGMLGANLFCNLVTSYFQSRRRGWKAVTKDWLFGLSHLKPGVDAWKVASGADHEENAMFDPKFELTFCKGIELATESIPGTLLQATVYLSTKEARTNYQVFSICTSILTTAFSTTTISFDWDVGVAQRLTSPDFYGYIPDGHRARLKVFLLMFVATIAHVTSTSVGMAMLITISPTSASLYVLASACVYLIYRVCRGDLHDWLPIKGKRGWVVSVAFRMLCKIIVDFTGLVQFLHPQEVGGAYYTISLLQAQVMSVVFALLYVDERAEDAVDADTVHMFVASVPFIWACSYSMLLASIKKKYIETFFDSRNAIQFNVDKFRDPRASDEQKSGVAGNTRIYWHSI